MGAAGSAMGSLARMIPGMGGSDPKPTKFVSKQEYDRIAAGLPGAGEGIAGAAGQSALSGYQVLPPPAPDLADETVQRARQAARRKLLMGGLTGPIDLTGGTTKPVAGLSGI